MNRLWNWIKSNKWVILVVITLVAAISMIFVDKDGIAEKEAVTREIVK